MSYSDSDDGTPLSARISKNRRIPDTSSSSSSDSDSVPLSKLSVSRVKKPAPKKPVANGRLARLADGGGNDSSSDSESDQPLSSKVKPAKKAPNGIKAAAPASKAVKKEPAPLKSAKPVVAAGTKRVKKEPEAAAVKKPKTEPKSAAAVPAKTKAAKKAVDRKPLIKTESSVTATSQDDSEKEDDEFKWWLEQNNNDDGPKWQTLEHHGVVFPPDYEPHGIPLLYDGKKIKLHPEAEEVATFFAALVGTDHGNNPTFQKNFFEDFKEIFDKHHPKKLVQEFSRCDFSLIRAHLDEQSAKRKARTKAEKEQEKKEKQAIDEKFSFCLLNGRRERVGNFRIEPPGLFRGRGAHPRTGKLKRRVLPEQVTINISKGAKIPDPPPGHKWANVIHDNHVTWLATWKENINNNIKYVFLAAGSSLKGMSDLRKFETARTLTKHIDAIRKQYTRDLKSEKMLERQRATAVYLIDRFALRAGNEKSDDEADTVGCCSLRCEHVTLKPPNLVMFDFLGKDSIRYERTTEVDKQVWKNLKLFKRPPKSNEDMIFDRLNTGVMNKHLQTLMPGLTAKVFRTYNASSVFQQQLANTPADGTEAEKILAYNRANRDVAVLCNHQRAVSKGFQGSMSKMENKILAARYQRMLLKNHLLKVAPMLKDKYPEIAVKEPGLTKAWIKTYLIETCELDREKARKKFERENATLAAAGEPLRPESKLEQEIAAIDEREKSIKAGTYEDKLPISESAVSEKFIERIRKITSRIKAMEVDMIDKDENKTTSLTTSKTNYIDPRISMAWCKKHGVPIEKIFSKTLRDKFTWASDVDSEWTF
ncbi:DNA topoisomerase 1 [Coemansia sp. Benny D115]|nr:DNA topoisomerase 1 [Coemansia sp. Benny D115]